jgi:hypothetical protein
MTDVNVQQYFSVTFQAALASNAAAAKRHPTRLQLVVEGAGGGSWVVDTTGKEPTCAPGSSTDADATLTLDVADLKAALEGQNLLLEVVKLFHSPKVKVEGRYERVLSFAPLLLLK